MSLRTGIWACILVVAALVTPAPVRPVPLRAEVPRGAEFIRRVNRGLEQGVSWLAGEAGSGGRAAALGYPGGTLALQYYTLRVCGVRRDDPAAKRAWSRLRAVYSRGGSKSLRVYSAALMCMAIQAHATQDMADMVGRPAGEQERRVQLADADAAWMKELVAYLQKQQRGGAWSYGQRGNRRGYDNSNSQYALLGLKAAAQCGVTVKNQTWRRALKHFLSAQDKDGPKVARGGAPVGKGGTRARAFDHARGWSYTKEGRAYGSMTAGGVGCVVICRSELIGTSGYNDSLDRRAEQSIRDGIAWLGHHFSVRANAGQGAGDGMWYWYYMYGLERAGVLAGVDWMGVRDWYGEGAEEILGRQLDDGSWESPAQGADMAAFPTVNTCFALLFLKKGTLGVRRGALTQPVDETGINFRVAKGLGEKDFEDFVDTVLSRWNRAKSSRDAAGIRKRLAESMATVGPRILPHLVQRLDSPNDTKRLASHAILTATTGEGFGYDPAAPRELREGPATQWQAWMLENQRHLAYDPETKRLVGAGTSK